GVQRKKSEIGVARRENGSPEAASLGSGCRQARSLFHTLRGGGSGARISPVSRWSSLVPFSGLARNPRQQNRLGTLPHGAPKSSLHGPRVGDSLRGVQRRKSEIGVARRENGSLKQRVSAWRSASEEFI